VVICVERGTVSFTAACSTANYHFPEISLKSVRDFLSNVKDEIHGDRKHSDK